MDLFLLDLFILCLKVKVQQSLLICFHQKKMNDNAKIILIYIKKGFKVLIDFKHGLI